MFLSLIAALSGIYYAGYNAGQTKVKQQVAAAQADAAKISDTAKQGVINAYDKAKQAIYENGSDGAVPDAIVRAIDRLPDPVGQ